MQPNPNGLTSNRPPPQVEINTPQGPQQLPILARAGPYVLVQIEHQGFPVEQAFLDHHGTVEMIESDQEYQEAVQLLNREP